MAVVGVATAGIASTTAQNQASQKPSSKAAPVAKLPPDEVDGLMAPVALYPDQLLAQMLVSATTPARVKELDAWLKTKPPFTGSALQDATRQTGYEPSLVALVIFPQVVDFMATNLDWTTEVGRAVSSDRAGVLDSVQRLRADALASGKLKTTPQQTVSLKTLDSGQNIIVIEPANAQVVHVPQYDPKTVYTEAPTSTTVVIQEEDDDAAEAMTAGLIGFTAGIAIGAAIDNDYYYGPYGWHGAPYMYNDAWDDWYDDREDAREDWYEHREDAREDVLEHREDIAEMRSDRAANAQEQRTERSETQTQRTQTVGAARRHTRRAVRTGTARARPRRGAARPPTPSPTTRAAGRNARRAHAASAAAPPAGAGDDEVADRSGDPRERRCGVLRPEVRGPHLCHARRCGPYPHRHRQRWRSGGAGQTFGPEGRDLVSGSDPATGRRNQQVFLAAIGEQWRLEDRDANTKELIVGNEDWPFPIPSVRSDRGWQFDAPAGREEILARRIGRNELAVIDVCRAYVKAQRAYARTAHDGNRAGLYAQRFGSEPGRQNGLYWPPTRHQPRSPLGDLVAGASDDGYDLGARKSPEPFHGYYFRILTAQGPAAPGGEMDYLRDNEMSDGFRFPLKSLEPRAVGRHFQGAGLSRPPCA